MNGFFFAVSELLASSAGQVSALLVNLGPKIIFAAALIGAGWIIASLARALTSKILKALGFNIFAEKTGIENFLKKGGVKRTPAFIAGNIIYWIIILNVFIGASEVFEAELGTGILEDIIIYIPRLAAVALIMALGIIGARFISRIASAGARMAGSPLSSAAGALAGYAAAAFALLLALNHLNIPEPLFTHISIIVTAVIPLFLMLLILTGGRNLVASLLSSRYISREFSPGDKIRFRNLRGEVIFTGPVYMKVKTETGSALIPNFKLASETVQKIETGS